MNATTQAPDLATERAATLEENEILSYVEWAARMIAGNLELAGSAALVTVGRCGDFRRREDCAPEMREVLQNVDAQMAAVMTKIDEARAVVRPWLDEKDEKDDDDSMF